MIAIDSNKPRSTYVEGNVYTAPTYDVLQSELNHLDSKYPREKDPSFKTFKFKSMRHEGWIL